MKLVFAEYLASLKERGELDVIIPDLLSELGLNVLSRPAIGAKQYGVDAMAVGKLENGDESLHLLSIKPGDLRRSNWSGNPQAVRPSIEQILDVYINTGIPARYRHLPVIISICLGGNVQQSVQADVSGFTTRNTRGRVSCEVWNGDKLAELLLSGVLREQALPIDGRSNLRKAIALVEEPDAAFRYFFHFVSGIFSNCRRGCPARLTALRQMYIGLWTLYVWARDAGNIEAAYVCSERGLLVAWELIKECFNRKTKAARQLRESWNRLMELYSRIASEYVDLYIEPRAKIRHGLSFAIPNAAPLDRNLRLFDLVGRVGLSGLWSACHVDAMDPDQSRVEIQSMQSRVQRAASLLSDMISNNPMLCSPIKDSQSIDINIACLLLYRTGHFDFIRKWVREIVSRTISAFRHHRLYPCIHNEYHKLIYHPRPNDRYREDATAGSRLIPTLAVWAALVGDGRTLQQLAEFAAGEYAHSSLQLSFPDSNSERHLYQNSAGHGAMAGGIKIIMEPRDWLSFVQSECQASNAYFSLSAVQRGFWALVVLACRHHRVPVPPHLWPSCSCDD